MTLILGLSVLLAVTAAIAVGLDAFSSNPMFGAGSAGFIMLLGIMPLTFCLFVFFTSGW